MRGKNEQGGIENSNGCYAKISSLPFYLLSVFMFLLPFKAFFSVFLAIKVATALQFYLLVYTFSNLPVPERLSVVPVVTVWTALSHLTESI